MSKRLILVLALAILVGLTLPVYAEVQNVKVSGDITVYGETVKNASVSGLGASRSVTLGAKSEARDLYTTLTRLRIDADLTDNVSTTVRLINERDWNESSGGTAGTRTTEVDLDLAYVTLKEFLYSPLTLVIGRQDIKIGSGLLIGNGVLANTSTTALLDPDLDARKAFDGIMAILDYDPWVFKAATLKILESARTASDDTDAYVLDAVYNFKDKNNSVAELTYVNVFNSGVSPVKSYGPQTIDILLTSDLLKNLAASIEYARQFGKTGATQEDKGWAFDAGLNFAFENAEKYKPTLGARYGYRSGTKDDSTPSAPLTWKSWRPLYEDQHNGLVLDPNTNVSFINICGTMKPTDDVTLKLDYYNFANAQKQTAVSGTSKGKKGLGNEIDLIATYDYTEDVQFGLTGAMFLTGADYDDANDANAMKVLGSMKVTF